MALRVKQKVRATPLQITLVVASLLVSIVGLIIGIQGLSTIYSRHRLGNDTILNSPPIVPLYSPPDVPESDWGAIDVSQGDGNFTPPVFDVSPHQFMPDLEKAKPICSSCNRRKASYLYRGMCFFVTNETFPFEDCFSVCRQVGPCYYFFYPTADYSAVVRMNLKEDTVWTGAFKQTSGGMWTDVFGAKTSVLDIYGSHCSYMSAVDIIPRSYYYCDFPRYCLCAGKSTIQR